MSQRLAGAASVLSSVLVLCSAPPFFSTTRAASIPPADAAVSAIDANTRVARELQLEVFINGAATEWIAAFRQYPDGTLAIAPEQLRNVGIEPAPGAMRSDGLIGIARLPNVSFEYDEASQGIFFTASPDALVTHILRGRVPDDFEPPRSGVGALLNYTLFGSTGGEEWEDLWGFEGVSGWFEARAFSPYGVLSSSQVASTSPNALYDSTRLETAWSYSSPRTMTTYRAGDLISGGLSWTRPIRLGGLQIRRNFSLRPDLVTMPLPEFSGSAAVPSTVDVYVNNSRRFSERVPAGPFQITNVPITTGSGTARVVVRDSLGRETVSETPFFAAAELLRPGLWDFSAEAGFARHYYGTRSNDYDGRPVASGTARYGVNDWLTLESHGEGGAGLLNGGGGAALRLAHYGAGSVAASASSFDGDTGFQMAASIELALAKFHVFARTQRTFGDYNDLASATFDRLLPLSPGIEFFGASPPRALDQISLSIPAGFDPTTFNLSYTYLERVDEERSRILGFSVNRPFWRSSFFATAYADLDNRDSFGLFAGLSIPLGRDRHAATGISHDSDGLAFTADLVKSERAEIGSIGWRLRDTEGGYVNRAASVSYRARAARLEAGVQQYENFFRATAQADGAVVLAGGDVFLANRIDDAFAVVDVGQPGVAVEFENRPVGRTNRRGKLLLTNLRSHEANRIAIDPVNLPVDWAVGSTREIAVPADRSGMVVEFDVESTANAALVILRDEAGEYVQPGATGSIESGEPFIVGYDGQAYITGLGATNRVVISQPNGGRCAAEFAFQPEPGEQVTVSDTVCRTI